MRRRCAPRCGTLKFLPRPQLSMELDSELVCGISIARRYKMSEESRAARVSAFAAQTLEKSGIWRNPYLQALRDGSMTLESFRRSQEQFFFAVSFFPRPMAALVGRIPNPKARLEILHNLVEEHGEFNEELFHHTTFQRFLRSLGSEPEKLDGV